MPELTVIIPNYNHARFLERRIQSVLDQTYQDFEILYLDDASTDASDKVFAQFADNPRIRAILNEKNSGSVFKQWNLGVREAQSKYIWIAEADDYADPRFLSVLVEKLESHPEVGLAYCQSLEVDENDKIGRSFAFWTDDLDTKHWQSDYISDGKEECAKYLLWKNTIPNASGIVFRRSVYEQAGYADETFRLCGDWFMWAKMLAISDIAFVAEPLNFFRQHANSVRENTKNGRRVEENFRLAHYMSQNLPLEPEVLKKLRASRIIYWIGFALNLPPRFTWKENLGIYRVACQSDPHLKPRLTKLLGAHYLYKWGLLNPALTVSRSLKRLLPKPDHRPSQL